jgi:hypothetical protein
MKKLFIMALGLFALASCKPGKFSVAGAGTGNNVAPGVESTAAEELQPAEYVKWCRDPENRLLKKKELEELTFSLQSKPAEYVVCMEQQKNQIPEATLQEGLKELEGLDYYDFKIEVTSGMGELLKHNVHSTEEYNNRVSYFAFDMQKDIKMIEGADTLDCALFHFERAYDVAPYAVFLLGFPKGKSASEKVFFYQDKVFNKGIIKFTYSPDELTRIPKLKAI